MTLPIVLASGSPYRQSLLRQIRMPFEVAVPGVNEKAIKDMEHSPQDLAIILAKMKGESVLLTHPNAIIIAADQVAHFNGKILSKPGSKEKAQAQLEALQGSTHELLTALWVHHPSHGAKTHLETARIRIRSLSSETISRYLELDQPYDCAGAYKIEQVGLSLIQEIQCADINSVVGLPMIALNNILREWNLPLPFEWNEHKSH